MIDNPVHGLTFGDLVWVEAGANPPDESGIVYRVQAQDASLGVAIPVTTALMWLGRVGGPVSWDSTPNREPAFRVTVEGDDSDLLARGEMALQLQAEQPTLLTWTPPDGAGEPSVFDIVWSHIEPVYDRDGLTGLGMEETVLRSRTYVVRMQALPYARGENLITTPALAVTPTYTLVDNGSALSGAGYDWAVIPGHTTLGSYTVTSTSGRIRNTNTPPSSAYSSSFERTGVIDLTPGRYVALDMAFTNLTGTTVKMDNGVSPMVAIQDLGGGLTRYFFDASWWGAQIPHLRISVTGNIPTTGSAAYAEIDQVQLANSIPFIGTARQRATSLVPKGSVRTQGSIHVTHASNALGKVIVYTHPSGTGYLPPLRQWRTSGNTVTTDATMNSGAREPIGPGSTVFRVPVPVLPTGRVELWAWLRVTSSSLTRAPAYAVRSVVNGVTLATSGGNFSIVFNALNTWQLFNLGALTSPPIAMGPSGFVQIDLNENSGQVDIDEAYLFATDLGDLTVVDCGTGSPSAGGPSKHLWIDAPTPDVPMGAIYRGHSDDRSDAFHAAPNADTWGDHAFDPKGTNVFVVTSNTTDAATSLEHSRRYHTFVVRED